MDGSVHHGGNKNAKPRQNSLKKQNSGGNYGRSPMYPQRRSNYEYRNRQSDDRHMQHSLPPAEGFWANQTLTSLLCNLFGCEIVFRLVDGREYEGIFEAFSPKGEFSFLLCCQVKAGVPDSKNVENRVLVNYSDIVSFSAKAVNIVNMRTEFDTDIGISQKISHGNDDKTRQLEAWVPDEDDTGMLGLEDDGEPTSNNGGWSADDMFKKNKPLQDKETKAGIVKSSRFVEYDGKSVDPFSNVTAHESEVTAEDREIAAHIEKTSATTTERVRLEKEDTEENFSAVLGNRATWQSNQGSGRGGSSQRGGMRARGGPGGMGRGNQPFVARKNDNSSRPPGLPPGVNQSPQTGYQNRTQQPQQGTPPPGAATQRGFSPKPSPQQQQPQQQQQQQQFVPPPTASQPHQSYASAAESQSESAGQNGNGSSNTPSYSSAAQSHYTSQTKGVWRQSNPQAIEQQKRDIVQHHQSQIDSIDRAALVQDLKDTTPAIAVSPSVKEAEEAKTASPMTRQTVTVKAGSGSVATLSDPPTESAATEQAESRSTPHPPASTENPSTPSATPSSATTTPSASASAFASHLKKLNPLAEEFVPRGTVSSPAQSTSASAIQSPTAASVVSPPQVVPPVQVVAAPAALPLNIPAAAPTVVSVINPPVVPQQPTPSTHHPQQSQSQQSSQSHQRGSRGSQQFSQNQSQQFASSSAAHDSNQQSTPHTPFAIAPQTSVNQMPAWMGSQAGQAGTPIATPYPYPVAAAPPSSVAISASRYPTTASGNPQQVTVTAQFTRPPTVVGGQPTSGAATSGTPIAYSTTGSQAAGQVVGKSGAPEFAPTFSILPAQYLIQGPPVPGVQSAGHPGAANMAFYSNQPSSQMMTLSQANSISQSQQPQTQQAVAQQIHQQQLQAQQAQQQQQQQQHQQQLAQHLQQVTLNGQLVQQALVAQQQYQQQQMAAQQQQQQQQQQHQHQQQQQQQQVQNQQQILANAQQQGQPGQGTAALTVSGQQQPFGQILYYPVAPSGQSTHPAFLQQPGVTVSQAPGATAQMIPTQMISFPGDPRYAMSVAQSASQQSTGHSNVTTPTQTPTGSAPYVFMPTSAYYPQAVQVVAPAAPQAAAAAAAAAVAGQAVTQSSGS